MRFRLSLPRSVADGTRALLIAGSVAVAGALVLAALHVLRGVGDCFYDAAYDFDCARSGYADFVVDPDLRVGVATAAFLLTVPVLALAAQALRVGSVARDRRMAALRLAGATPRDVRIIAAGEASFAALAGVAFAGPVYVLLWLLVGVLPPAGARLLDGPDWLDGLIWVGLAPVGALAGALAGSMIQGRVLVEPLGVRRRTRTARPGGRSVLALIFGGALLVFSVNALNQADDYLFYELLAIVGVFIAAFAGGPWLVLASAWALDRRPGAEALLAARRLRTDVRSGGRVAAVLLVCGLTLSIDAFFGWQILSEDYWFDGDWFYVIGISLVAGATGVGAAVALITLLVGAGDSLVDARRPLATLAALGLDQRALTRILARQLRATAAPAIGLGALVGAPLLVVLVGVTGEGYEFVGTAVQAGVAAAVVSSLAVCLAAPLAAWLLRPLTRAVTAPENLRAP